MQRKEISEIRKSFNLKHCSINKIWETFYNSEQEKSFSNSFNFDRLKDEEKLAYIDIFKKVLSSNLYKNTFNAKLKDNFIDSEKTGVYKTYKNLDDSVVFDFIDEVSNIYKGFEDNGFLSLMCEATYEVPIKENTDKVLDVDSTYNFIIFAICPLKTKKPNLIQSFSDKRFILSNNSMSLSIPELGFLYPSFNSRTADINEALLFIKNEKGPYGVFSEVICGENIFENELYSKNKYDSFINNNISDLSFEKYSSINESIRNFGVEMEEDGLEPLLTNSVLERIAPNDFNLNKDVSFNAFSVSSDKYVFSYPESNDLKLSINSDGAKLIEEKKIDGIPYILIPATGLQVNGVNIKDTKQGGVYDK